VIPLAFVLVLIKLLIRPGGWFFLSPTGVLMDPLLTRRSCVAGAAAVLLSGVATPTFAAPAPSAAGAAGLRERVEEQVRALVGLTEARAELRRQKDRAAARVDLLAESAVATIPGELRDDQYRLSHLELEGHSLADQLGANHPMYLKRAKEFDAAKAAYRAWLAQFHRRAESEFAEARREADAVDARLREVTARFEAARGELIDLVAAAPPAG
jgi:hypothetical protein